MATAIAPAASAAVAGDAQRPPPIPLDAIHDELARRSFEWWARLRFRILDKDGRDAPLILNKAQRLVLATEERLMRERGEVRLFVLKGRQGGVTTFEQARSLHLCSTTEGVGALTLTDNGDTTEKVFYITQYALERGDGSWPALGDKRAHELIFTDLASRFFTGTAGGRRVGRAITLRRFHGSEFAMWDAPRKTLKAVTPALVPNGSTIVLETTASGFESEAHKFWKECLAGKNSYTALFIPWWLCDEQHYRLPLFAPDELGRLADDEQALVKAQGLTLEQIKWRRKMIGDMGYEDFLQEYPEDEESCWLAAGGMYYSAAELRILIQRAPTPIETDLGGEREVFAHPVEGERVILGADTAEGTGGDASTYVARAFEGWKLKETFSSNTIAPREFAALLASRGRAFGGALLVVEKNMHGITVLRHLRDDEKYPIGLIYHRMPPDQAHPEASERIGWATTEESKPIMLSAGRELLNAAKTGLAGMPAKAVLLDALGVRRDKNGRYDLNGRDILVGEMLAWIGRGAPLAGRGMFEWMQMQAAARAAEKSTAATGNAAPADPSPPTIGGANGNGNGHGPAPKGAVVRM
jgi:hypothetical protein